MRDILWVDLETTGLDPSTHRVVEYAFVLTDPKGDVLGNAHGVCYRENYIWEEEAMKMALESGLLDEEPTKTEDDMRMDLAYLRDYSDKSPLLGGLGPHFDRAFLEAVFERGHSASPLGILIHYRHIDIRSYLEVLGDLGFTADLAREHRALPDILQTIRVYEQIREAMQELEMVAGLGQEFAVGQRVRPTYGHSGLVKKTRWNGGTWEYLVSGSSDKWFPESALKDTKPDFVNTEL